MNSPHPVLFFDAECGLCLRLVRWLLALDRGRRLRYAALQGQSARLHLFGGAAPADPDSLVFVDALPARSAPQLRTAGLVAALRETGAAGRALAGLIQVVPRSLRDAGYRAVARVRRRLGIRPVMPDFEGRLLD